MGRKRKREPRYLPELQLNGVSVVPDKGLALIRSESLVPGDSFGFNGAHWELESLLCATGFYRDSVELWEVRRIDE